MTCDDIKSELRRLLSYDPETGVIVWTQDLRSGVHAGDVAGRFNRQGYRRIQFRNKEHLSHRVAWLLMTGDWPNGFIDHRNLDRADNRWCNLREATSEQNTVNSPGRGKWAKGVSFHKRSGKFVAQIKVSGRSRHLGSFETEGEAAQSYAVAAVEAWGEYARTAA